MTAIRDAALAMAARGFPVFPLQPDSKKPYEIDTCEHRVRPLAGGQNRATRNAETIKSWFEIEPGINYGISTNGMAVIDVDVKNGQNGLDDLLALGKLPPTFTVLTPSGGAHYYFSGAEVSQRKLSKAIDVRSKGGYTVGPQSTLDGEPWTIWRDVPVAPLPEPIYERMTAAREHEAVSMPVAELDQPHAIEQAIEYLKAEPPVDEGARNNTAFLLACRLKDFGLSARSIHETLQAHWNARNPEPLTDGEIESISENCFKSGRYAPGCANTDAEFGDLPELLKDIYPKTDVEVAFGPVTPGRSMADIPARPWLVPQLLLKGQVTLLSAQPGARKSTLTVAIAVGCALGTLKHIGFELRADPMDVILINNEDDEDEVDRRIAACCLLHGFSDEQYQEAKSRIHVYKPSNRMPFKAVGRHPNSRLLLPTKAMEGMKAYADINRVGLIIADPLASLHDGVENDNGEMARVFYYFLHLLRANASLPMLLVHHSRKPDMASSQGYAGDPFSSRGASAIHGAVRLMLTLNTCNEEDAVRLGLRGPEEHLDFSRLDMAKDSNSPPGKHTKYLKCEGVRVGPPDAGDTAPALQLFDHKEQTELLVTELHEAIKAASGLFDSEGKMALDDAADAVCDRIPVDEDTARAYLELHFARPVSRDGVMFRVEGRGKKAVLTTDLNCERQDEAA